MVRSTGQRRRPSPGAGRSPALVDEWLGMIGQAELAIAFGIIALVGEHLGDPRHHAGGGEEQRSEESGVVDVRGGDGAGHRRALPLTATWYFVPGLARSVGLGPVSAPPRLARTRQLSRIRTGLPRSMLANRAWT
jgi:hypothetical protein